MSKGEDAVTIIPTEFKDIRTGEVSFGFRAFDSIHFTYCNSLEEIPKDDMEFLTLVVDNGDDVLIAMLEEKCITTNNGLFIGNTWYEHDDVIDIVDPV